MSENELTLDERIETARRLETFAMKRLRRSIADVQLHEKMWRESYEYLEGLVKERGEATCPKTK